MYNIIVSKEFTVTLSSGKIITAEFESVWDYDPDYGADIDGNRGISVDSMVELYLTVPPDDASWGIDDNGEPLTQNERDEAQFKLFDMAENDDWEERFNNKSMYY